MESIKVTEGSGESVISVSIFEKQGKARSLVFPG